MITKTCKRCGEEKPDSDFYKQNTRAGVREAWCSKCKKSANRQYRKEHPEKTSTSSRRRRYLKKTYGLTVEEHKTLFDRQNGVCAICRQSPKNEKLHIDHCHNSGKIRSLLCGSCNRGLGLFQENTHILKQAIDYIGKFSEPRTIEGPIL